MAAGPDLSRAADGAEAETEAGDARLLTRLAELLEATEPIPSEVALAAKDMFTWRDFIDAQVAMRQEEEGQRVRGTDLHPGPGDCASPDDAAELGGYRLETFAAPDLIIMLEISDDGGIDGRRLIGQLVPPGPDGITLESARTPGGERYAPVDKIGRFRLSAVETGRIRLHCVLPAGQSVMTQWLAC